jgi:hypothetical protein
LCLLAIRPWLACLHSTSIMILPSFAWVLINTYIDIIRLETKLRRLLTDSTSLDGKMEIHLSYWTRSTHFL